MKFFVTCLTLLGLLLVYSAVWAQEGSLNGLCPDEAALPEDTVCIEWEAPTENVDGTPLTDLAGYNVFYGFSSRQYGEPIPLMVPDATHLELSAETEIVIPAPSGGGVVDVYFAMTALDDDGNESELSNEVVKQVTFPDNLPPGKPTVRRVLIKVRTS